MKDIVVKIERRYSQEDVRKRLVDFITGNSITDSELESMAKIYFGRMGPEFSSTKTHKKWKKTSGKRSPKNNKWWDVKDEEKLINNWDNSGTKDARKKNKVLARELGRKYRSCRHKYWMTTHPKGGTDNEQKN